MVPTIGKLQAATSTRFTGESSTQMTEEVDSNQPQHESARLTFTNHPRERRDFKQIRHIEITVLAFGYQIKRGRGTLQTCGEQAFQEMIEHLDERFIGTKVKGTHMYSWDALSAARLAEYERMLSALILDARERGPKILAGNFNASALEWGSWTMMAIVRARESQGSIMDRTYLQKLLPR